MEKRIEKSNDLIKNNCLFEKLLWALHRLHIISLYENTSLDFVKDQEKVCNLAVAETIVEKTRILQVLKLLGDIKDKMGLDIGCGGGALSCLVAKENARLFVMDIGRNSVSYTIKQGKMFNIRGVQATAEKLPFKSNTFDFCLSTEAIEHVPFFGDAIREMHRILKDNTILVISIPNSYGLQNLMIDLIFPLIKGIAYKLLWKKPPSPANGHLHMFTRRSFSKIVQEIGFDIEDIQSIIFPVEEFPKNRYMHPSIFKTMQTTIKLLGKIYSPFLVGSYSFKLRKKGLGTSGTTF